jgi:hypothetical protein
VVLELADQIKYLLGQYQAALGSNNIPSAHRIAANLQLFRPRLPPPSPTFPPLQPLPSKEQNLLFTANNAIVTIMPYLAQPLISDGLINCSSNSIPIGNSFGERLYDLVSAAPLEVVTWDPTGSSFIIADINAFETQLLPQFYQGMSDKNCFNVVTLWLIPFALIIRLSCDDLYLQIRRILGNLSLI